MRRVMLVAGLALFVVVNAGRAQELLKTDGYGSLSGKVTLDGKIPDVIDLTKVMMGHQDKACCLDPKAKPLEKVDQRWIVDPKTKAVANVMIWVKPPVKTYFEIHPMYKVRKDNVIIDQPHCAYVPYVSAYQPSYFDGKEMVPSGQELIFKNSASVGHNVHAVADGKINVGFNRQIIAGQSLNATKDLDDDIKLKPQLMPITLGCGSHTWMQGRLYVFDHPYYAITKADGTFEIPFVPAGAEIRLMAHHGDGGWVLKELKQGRAITFEKGKKTTIDLELKAP